MEGFFHCCSEGLSDAIIFKDRKDYIFGMNAIALIAFICNVKVIAFCLMDNHFHFLLHGEEANCEMFMRKYRRKVSRLCKTVLGADLTVIRIPDKESLKRVIAYILRNPIAAGIQTMPNTYEWSSGRLYFAPLNVAASRGLNELNEREKRLILSSRSKLPDEYRVNNEGMILPESYVYVSYVQNLYKTPKALMAFCVKDDDMEQSLNSGVLSRHRFTDAELIPAVNTLVMELFGASSPDELDIESRCVIAKSLRRRYTKNLKQIGRLVHLEPDMLKDLFGR